MTSLIMPEFVDDHPSASDGGAFHTPSRNDVTSRDRDFRPTRRRGFDDDKCDENGWEALPLAPSELTHLFPEL